MLGAAAHKVRGSQPERESGTDILPDVIEPILERALVVDNKVFVFEMLLKAFVITASDTEKERLRKAVAMLKKAGFLEPADPSDEAGMRMRRAFDVIISDLSLDTLGTSDER